MCYSGKCKYEQYYGDCGWDFNLGDVPLDALCYQQKIYTYLNRESERVKDMKILNKNKKLKHSKMFIDLDSYRKICEKYGTTLTEHLERIERYQNKDDATPDMQDISIMYDVYMYITKVIRPRRQNDVRRRKK